MLYQRWYFMIPNGHVQCRYVERQRLLGGYKAKQVNLYDLKYIMISKNDIIIAYNG